MMKHLAMLLAIIALTGCRRGAASADATISPEDLLSDAARAEWHVFVYTVVDGKVAPFAEQGFDTREEAASDVCKTLQIEPDELVEMDEDAVDDYILKTTRNRWSSA